MLHCICMKLSVKANHSDEKEQKELRSEVGIQVDQAKAENKSLRVKPSIRGSNIRVSGVADFESWKYGDTFLEKSYRRPRCSDWTFKICFGKRIQRSTTFQLTMSSNLQCKRVKTGNV